MRDFYKPFENDQMVNVAVVMGLIYPGSKMGIREGLYNGGPLGEMIQWTDILTAMNSFENIKWDFKIKKIEKFNHITSAALKVIIKLRSIQ